MDDFELHRKLIGQQGSRRSLNTPVLVVDADALERNIAAMAAFAEASGVKLRPHAKTHKSVDIAKRQRAAGAVGFCCAKLGEAEALADGGLDGLLITSPVVSASAIERLVALNGRTPNLMVVVDNPANVDALAGAASAAGKPLKLLVDIDPGIRRTGVEAAEAAVALAARIGTYPSLSFEGVQYYCGGQQHIGPFLDRRLAITDRTTYLREVVETLTAAGLKPGIVSGGGTGSHRIDAALGAFTEWQVGSYVFMDRQYAECDLTGDGVQPFETSLLVDARVVSANSQGMVTIDAGFKAFATDGDAPLVVSGADGAMFAFMGDEHGALFGFDTEKAPRLADIVTLSVPHCDPTVNLYDNYHVVRGDTLVDIWPVSARGRSR